MDGCKIAAAYIRVSTDDQSELSPDSQLSAIREYAAKNGCIVPEEHVYVDEGISGRTAAKRPAFNKMIAAAKEKEHFDCILVWKFSRFARNQEESIVYKAMLRKDGIDVISISEPLIEGPFGDLIERILEWMDEYYSVRLSGEVKRSMTLNAQRGVRQTVPPFGYELVMSGDKRVMVPKPSEAGLVVDIFRRFLSGEGVYAIARYLNSIGVTTHRGGGFENRTVEYILRNPVYIGKNRWTPTGRVRRRQSAETIIADSAHEPLIDLDTWDAAQKRLDEIKAMWRYKARPSYELKDWLSGVVRCAACGGTLIFARPQYFRCNNYVRGRCRFTQNIRVDLLHEAVIGRLRDDMSGAEPLTYEVSSASGDTEAEAHRMKLALDALERKLTRIREAYAAGVETLEDYKAYREEITAEKATILERLAAKDATNSEKIVRDLRKNLESAVKVLEDAATSKEDKNNAIKSVVSSMMFDKKTMKLQIVYRVFL